LLADGLTADEVRLRQLFIDSAGVVQKGQPGQDLHKQEVALTKEELAAIGIRGAVPQGLEAIIRAARPSVLIGTSGQPGDFTPAAIQAMAQHCERPLIFPLSNPTDKAECTPANALKYSDGRALVATGSPFDPVVFNGRRHVIGQCNNVFVFPGVGLGALISEASRVTDSMFLAAAKALAEFTSTLDSKDGSLYPRLRELRRVSQLIAFEVAKTARDEGLGRSMDDRELKAAIAEICWFPDYPAVA
jgi:malic enzyme